MDMKKERKASDSSVGISDVPQLGISEGVVVSSILKETYSILFYNEYCYDTSTTLQLDNSLNEYDPNVNTKIPEKLSSSNTNEMTSSNSDFKQKQNDSPCVYVPNRKDFAASPRINMSTVKQDFPVEHFQCEICAKQFLYASSLTRHKRIHAGKRTHSCSVCGKAFYFEYEVTNHMTVHTNDKMHVCATCDKKYAHRQSLLRHQMLHENKMLECNQCQKQFTRKDKLERHTLVHQSKSKCPRCSKEVFHTAEHIKRCVEGRVRNYVCPVCGRTFLEQRYLQGHCRSFHSC